MSRKKKQPPARPARKSRRDGVQSTASPRHEAAPGSAGPKRRIEWARWLWAGVTTVAIGALLFEPTMLWTLSIGFWMLAEEEFIGLWLIVGGYVMACVPWAFGLLIATGRFWRALTHALWLGLVYGGLGYLFLDQIMGLL